MRRIDRERAAKAATLLRTWGRDAVYVDGIEYVEDPYRGPGHAVPVLRCPTCEGEGTVWIESGWRMTYTGPEPTHRQVRCANCHDGWVHGAREYWRARQEYADCAEY